MPSYNNPCYLLMQLLNIGPVAVVLAIGVANLTKEATVLLMGESMVNVRVLIISKPFVIPRLQQPRQHPALSRRNSLSCCQRGHPQGATVAMAKEAGSFQRRRRCPRSCQSRKHTRLHSKPRSHQKWQLHLVERKVKYYKTQTYEDQMKQVCTTGFLAMQLTVNWLKAPMLRVSLLRGCTWILTQTIGLR